MEGWLNRIDNDWIKIFNNGIDFFSSIYYYHIVLNEQDSKSNFGRGDLLSFFLSIGSYKSYDNKKDHYNHQKMKNNEFFIWNE